MDYCKFIDEIKQDPAKKITGLKIRDFLALKEHIADCHTCADAVDNILEREKDTPPSIDTSRYN